MNGPSHRDITLAAVKILEQMGVTVSPIISFGKTSVASSTVEADHDPDLEFVDVDAGMDNPHTDQGFWTNDDEAHYSYDGRDFTAFNHFIDIKKGPGIFDDYDGYSYEKGSASKDEYQDASEKLGWFKGFLADLAGFQVDEGIMWWFNDEYVHAPGHSWYKNCSPSLKRYSFYQDKGVYSSPEAEIGARFKQSKEKGVPYSVFMPVDNMARYWYFRYVKSETDVDCLGYVMHAVQDAVVPHHAAGYMGNWHEKYENDLEMKLPSWMKQADFIAKATQRIKQWNYNDPNPPTQLQIADRTRSPAINWRIDMLITWLALNAYHEYAKTHEHFKYGYQFNEQSMRELANKSLAMSAFILIKAGNEAQAKSIGASAQWTKIRELVGSVIAAYSEIEGNEVVYATDSRTGDIYRWNGTPNSWTKIGGPGKAFVIAGLGKLYGLSPDGSGIYEYSGTPNSWKKVGGGAKDIYGGPAGLYLIQPNSGDIHRYSEGSWTKIGGPGKMFTVGKHLYGLSPDGKGIYRYEGTPNEWKKIGNAAKEIFASDDKVYATIPPSGDITIYIPDTSKWIKIGGPGKMFAAGRAGRLYGLSPDGKGVYKYRGFPGKWKNIGYMAKSICAAGYKVFALTAPPGVHQIHDHDLWCYL